MTEFQPIPDEDNIWLRKKRPKPVRPPGDDTPWITLICCILCGGIFILIHALGGHLAPIQLGYALYPSNASIWTGAWWGPLTSAFVHFDFLHVAFNIYWLYYFGKIIERYFGTTTMILLVVSGAYLSSVCQIAFSEGGIGASGFNYTLFGFLWVARKKNPDLYNHLPDRLVQFFLIWLVACFFLTKAGILPVANAAHTSGLVFGCTVASTFLLDYPRRLTIPALSLLTMILLFPLFYAPWAPAWMWKDNWNKGYQAVRDGRYEEGIEFYEKTLRHFPDDEGARINLHLARKALGLTPDERWPPPESRE